MNDESKNLSQGLDNSCAKVSKYGRYWLILMGWMITLCANAQLVVTPEPNATNLAQALVGTGVTINNATRFGDVSSTGLFTYNGSSLGLSGGVILSTGRVINASKTANLNASNSLNSGNGDAQLQTLTTGSIYDKTVLEFDVVPQGNVLKFEYVFMSEEYPEFSCSQFNDVFGFFITGQNPNGGNNYNSYNIARIPNTNWPVAINTINQGTKGQYGLDANCSGSTGTTAFSSLFRNNLTPVINQDIVFDGMTVVLTATVAVIPCRTYHLKLAVGDVNDRIFDSGVMLKANSFTSIPVTITSRSELDYAGYSSAYEGCVKGKFKFTIPTAQTSDVSVNIQVSGTATPGTDYTTIAPIVTIPAGQTSAEIDVLAIQDNIAEADETVTVSTFDPCSGNALSSATIVIKDDVQPSITVSSNSICAGQSAQITATGGVSFSWTPTAGLSDATSGNLTAAPSNTTTYTANMAWGSCNKTATTTINVGGPAITFNNAIAPVICNGAPVQVTANAGAGNMSYNWSNGTNGATANISNAGTYTVSASDNTGCSSTASITVGAASLSVSGNVSNATCSGGNDGAISLTVNGNNNTYNYFWSNNSNAQSIANLTPGSYAVTVSNADGCSATQSFSISQAGSNITATLSSVDPTCYGASNGTINVSVSGGQAPYTFNWGNNITTQNRTGLTASNYTVTVADASGCSVVKSVSLAQMPPIAINPTKVDANCANGTAGSINLAVAGGAAGYTYQWNDNNPNANRTGLTAGAYSVVVTDANGCSASVVASIASTGSIDANFNYAGTYCAPSAAVSFTNAGTQNGVTHVWQLEGNNTSSQAAPSYTYASAGSYTVAHTVSNAVCSNTVTKTINVKPQPAIAASVEQIPCNGGGDGSITLNVTNGLPPYAFNWGSDVTSQNRMNLGVGNYNVVVTDANNCSSSYSAAIVDGSPINVSENHNNVTCHSGTNGSINITATGGILPYSYRWSNGDMAEDIANVPAAQYIVTVTDAHDCSAITSIAVTQPEALQVSLSKTDATCYGASTGAVSVSVTGGVQPLSYLWSNAVQQANLSNVQAGGYTLSVTDAAGCRVVANATVAQPQAITINETLVNPTCFGRGDGSIALAANGGAGTYTFKLNNNNVQGVINGLQAGVYHVEAIDASGCSTLKDISLVAPAAMELNATIENEKCGAPNTGSVSINVIGGNAPYTYTWNNSMTGNSINLLGAGTYVVAVVDAKGCTQTKANVVSASQGLKVAVAANELPCNVAKGEASITVLNGLAPYTFAWANGAITPSLNNVLPGTYAVTIRDAAGCAMDTVVTISNNNSFAVAVEGAAAIELGETVELKAVATGSADVSYTWVPAFGLQCPTCASVTVRPAETTIYKVTAVDATYGCVATAEANIVVGTETNVFLPNAFTPNGDGQNDVLELYGNRQSIRYFQLLVFNRWGEKVYETNDQFFNWDANYKGEKLEPGAYLYVMKIVHLNNETSRTFKGSISLLK